MPLFICFLLFFPFFIPARVKASRARSRAGADYKHLRCNLQHTSLYQKILDETTQRSYFLFLLIRLKKQQNPKQGDKLKAAEPLSLPASCFLLPLPTPPPAPQLHFLLHRTLLNFLSLWLIRSLELTVCFQKCSQKNFKLDIRVGSTEWGNLNSSRFILPFFK